MTTTNEDSEMWREIHQEEQRKGESRKVSNLAILRASTVPFQYRNDGGVVLVRDKGYPSIDFWPTKNKWLVGNRYTIGDAKALLNWLERRAMK